MRDSLVIRFPRVPRRGRAAAPLHPWLHSAAPWGEEQPRPVDGKQRGSEARVAVLDLHCLGERQRVAEDARSVPLGEL
jgi:hypothetical protein